MIVDNANGMWVISALVNGHLTTRKCTGYTKKQAIKMFKQEVQNVDTL